MKKNQIAIVGGGPAGLTAAIAGRRAGADVVLLDEWPVVGGGLRYRIGDIEHTPYGPCRPAVLADRLAADAVAAGVDIVVGSVVWGIFPQRILSIATTIGSYELQTEQIILATGSTDLPYPFSGGSLPGVFTARALQRLLNLHRVRPGRRFVVVGTGSEAQEIVTDITLAGGQIVAQIAADRSNTLSAAGVTGIEVVTIDDQTYEAEIVVVAVGRQPDVKLALLAECPVGYQEHLGGWTPLRDQHLQTRQSGIWVAGDTAGNTDIETALMEGTLAGTAAAMSLGLGNEDMLHRALADYERVAHERIHLAATMTSTYVQTIHEPVGVGS